MNDEKLNRLLKKIEEIELNKKSWLNINECSDYLSISKSKIRKLISNSEIPFKRIGNNGTIRFNTKMIDMWMLSNGEKQKFNKRDKMLLEILK